MRKTLLLTFVILAGFAFLAQGQSRPAVPKALKDVMLTHKAPTLDSEAAPMKMTNPTVKSGNMINEETIGETVYDLQTNGAVQNRFWRYADGTMAGTWTMGMNSPWSDRGTGYNYFDGTAWGAYPSARIETVANGWPSYAPWGTGGEIVVSHQSPGSGLVISNRTTRGSGTWTENLYAGPVGRLLWPRMTTGGVDNGTVHMFALTAPVANGGAIYNGMDGALVYFRSQDGGTTWDKEAIQPPGTDSSLYTGFSGDGYSIAARGNTVAFVVGDNWYDLFLLKSTDNGDTWTKTTIFEHPYPKFDEGTTLVIDTPYVTDGASAVAIDENGTVHVAFGCMRVLNDAVGDEQTSWFPFVDGIGYWREGDPTLTTADMDPDTLFANDRLIGWWQDIDQNDTIQLLFNGTESIGLYYLSPSSMPQLATKGDTVYLVYSSITEGKDNGLQNFRHLFGRASFNGGDTWHDNFAHLTRSIIHNFDECVFPSVAPFVDNSGVHLIYQADEEPGLHIRGDEDAPTDNSVIYMKVTLDEFVGINEMPQIIQSVAQNFPNPAADYTTITIDLKKAANLSLEITNLMGQQVMNLEKGKAMAGTHSFELNVSNLTPGVYFYTVHADMQSVTKKMIVQ